MKIQIKYRRARPYVEHTRAIKCFSCGKVGRTELHHYIYKYTTAEIKKNPQLAMENTIELCFPCHRCADWLRNIEADKNRATMVEWAIHYAKELDKKEKNESVL